MSRYLDMMYYIFTEHLLSKDKEFKHICLPAEYNENTIKPELARKLYKHGLLDPNRLSPANLKELTIDLGAVTYQAQVNQNPADKSNSIIQEDWIPIVSFAD